ncbi:MAG: arylesterase [Planctomycetota bacterium]
MITACGEEHHPGEVGSAHNEGTSHARVILFLGDSLTAGHGMDPEAAYPALIQQRLDPARWRVVNAGVSGDTTAGGLRRIDWLLSQRIDVAVIALGANDGLRGLPVEGTRANLEQIIAKIRAASRDAIVVLAGMKVPPNMGPDYARQFADLFPEIASAQHVPLIPFLLEGVAGDPALNQPDGIHPTPRGHEIIAATVWHTLAPLLNDVSCGEGQRRLSLPT